MSLADLKREYTRSLILRLLQREPGYVANENLLASQLDELGQALAHDALRVQLAWLAEQGLVTTKTLMGVMVVASLTLRGHDVAKGNSIVPGVKRPDPEETI